MAISYPDRTNARGIWKLSDITRNIKTEGTFPGSGGDRAIFSAGQTPSNVSTIDYVSVRSLGDATDFGDLTSTERVGGRYLEFLHIGKAAFF